MIKRYLEGILTAVVLGVTNARAEGLNANIQWIKATARASATATASATPSPSTSAAPTSTPPLYAMSTHTTYGRAPS